MKKIFNLFVVIAAVIAFGSCDPLVKTGDPGGAITADQLDVTVTPVMVDGVRSNKLVLNNNSPVLSSWNYGMGMSQSAHDSVLVTSVGDMVVTFTGMNPDGSIVTKDIPVTVDAIVFKVVGMDLLIGDGSKTWVWDQYTNEQSFSGDAVYPYGIGGIWGGNGDKAPVWWGLTFGDPSFTESDATMTFALDGGAIFTKNLADGTKQKGTFSFNLTKKFGNDWSQGILSLKGATIPHPYSMNNGGPDAYNFYILELEADNLVLATFSGNIITDDPKKEGEVNIWMFRPEGWTAVPNTEQMAAITGGSERTWTWDAQADAVWGNGSYLGNTAPGWWTVPIGDANLENQVPGEGKGATMTFSMTGAMTKNRTDGTTQSGTFSIDMTKPTYTDEEKTNMWAMGKLKTKDITILIGVNVNDGKKPVYSYDILSLNDEEMVLAFPEDASGGAGSTAWFYMFRAVK